MISNQIKIIFQIILEAFLESRNPENLCGCKLNSQRGLKVLTCAEGTKFGIFDSGKVTFLVKFEEL